MDMSPQEYQAYIKQKSPKSPIWKDTALAFLIGGAICVLGQGGHARADHGLCQFRRLARHRLQGRGLTYNRHTVGSVE